MNSLSRLRFTSLSLASFVCVTLLGACATPASYKLMVPQDFDTAKKHAKSVSVSVVGGIKSAFQRKSQISDAAFAQALVMAIVESQTFSRVTSAEGAQYLLTVALISLEQPSVGLNFTVEMQAGWSLKRADTGAVVWEEAIKSAYTATLGDNVIAVVRMKHATEGAARNNIRHGLAKISRLTLYY